MPPLAPARPHILWDVAQFSNRRNLSFQGQAGVAYRLCGAQFVTSVLPRGAYFLSSTPAIIPKDPEYLDLITGTATLIRWRVYVRSTVQSINFTPGAIADLFCPAPDSRFGCEVANLGRLVRRLVGSAIQCDINAHALDRRLRVVNRHVQDLDEELRTVLKLPSGNASMELPRLR